MALETSIGDEGPAGIAFLFDDLTVRRTLRNGLGWLGASGFPPWENMRFLQ